MSRWLRLFGLVLPVALPAVMFAGESDGVRLTNGDHITGSAGTGKTTAANA